MKRYLIAVVILSACTPEADFTPGPELPFVRDYRAEGDECFLVGEGEDTVKYLDDAADLVACPTDYEGIGVFVTETGATLLDAFPAFTLFSVPVR